MQAEVASMSDKIKRYFAKKKADAKFKTAGPGHKLSEDGAESSGNSSRSGHQHKAHVTPRRNEPSQESRSAANAALARISHQNRNVSHLNTSLMAIKLQVKRELEAEKLAASESSNAMGGKDAMVINDIVASPHLVATGVYFKCPIVSEEVLTREEWKCNIKTFLYDQLSEERGLTACLIIHSCNSNKEKINNCVQTLCKYLENIIDNPTEDKYHRIRMSNRVFTEKVMPMEGSMEFLLAAGFAVRQIKNQDEVDEDFLVFNPDLLNNFGELHDLIENLRTCEPIALELDRNVQVLLPSQASKQTELPLSFYSVTAVDIKKDHQNRLEAIEKCQMLRTKAMREQDERRDLRRYLFAVIRVRFPDGILLQGTFYVHEMVKEIFEFVKEYLEHEHLAFLLHSPDGHQIKPSEDGDKSLLDMKLVPATILTFAWDPSAAEELGRCEGKDLFLKPEVMLLVRQ